MYYVYVLKSESDKNLYVGYTNDLRRRLKEHNTGKSFSTAPRKPFNLIYYESYLSKLDAEKREQALKRRGQARYHLKERLKESLRQAQS